MKSANFINIIIDIYLLLIESNLKRFPRSLEFWRTIEQLIVIMIYFILKNNDNKL